MARIVYLGDEATAAGFRLAGVDARVASAGDAAAMLRRRSRVRPTACCSTARSPSSCRPWSSSVRSPRGTTVRRHPDVRGRGHAAVSRARCATRWESTDERRRKPARSPDHGIAASARARTGITARAACATKPRRRRPTSCAGRAPRPGRACTRRWSRRGARTRRRWPDAARHSTRRRDAAARRRCASCSTAPGRRCPRHCSRAGTTPRTRSAGACCLRAARRSLRHLDRTAGRSRPAVAGRCRPDGAGSARGPSNVDVPASQGLGAGLRIRAGDACLDATVAGLLAARERIAAELLAEFERLVARGARSTAP